MQSALCGYPRIPSKESSPPLGRYPLSQRHILRKVKDIVLFLCFPPGYPRGLLWEPESVLMLVLTSLHLLSLLYEYEVSAFEGQEPCCLEGLGMAH